MKDRERQLAEQQKYGIDFDDEYNYLQHLKSVSELYDSEMVEVRKDLHTVIDAILRLAFRVLWCAVWGWKSNPVVCSLGMEEQSCGVQFGDGRTICIY